MKGLGRWIKRFGKRIQILIAIERRSVHPVMTAKYRYIFLLYSYRMLVKLFQFQRIIVQILKFFLTLKPTQ